MTRVLYAALVPCGADSWLRLGSVVRQQFGEAIRETVREVLAELGVENASVSVRDRGALDCVIRARVETAVRRGRGND